MKRILLLIVCGLMILFISPVYAVEIKPFISGSIILINSTDWLNPDSGYYIKPNHAATLKAGISLKEEGVITDINFFHLSNPANGTIGDLPEGDAGINGLEFSVRKEF